MNESEQQKSEGEQGVAKMVVDADGRFIRANDGAEDIYDISRAELMEMDWRETLVKICHHHEETFQNLLDEGGTCEVEILRGDGSTAVVQLDRKSVV